MGASPRISQTLLSLLLIGVSLGLLIALLLTLRAHRGATESDSVDRLRSHDRRSLQIAQNVWLRDLSTVLSRAVSRRDVAAIMAKEGAIAAGSTTAEIALLDSGCGLVAFVAATANEYGASQPPQVFALADRTPTTDAIRTGENVLVLSRADLAERYPKVAAVPPQSERTEASACLPLVDSESRIIGAMVFGCRAENLLDDGQLVVFETATELCARALDRVRLYELEYEARRLAENLQAFTMVLAGTESRTDVAEALVNESIRVIGADSASVWVVVDDAITMLVGQGLDDRTSARPRRELRSVASPVSDALMTRVMIVLESPDELIDTYPNLRAQVQLDGDQAWVALPLAIGGEASAVLFAVFRTPRLFSAQDRSLLSTMGLQAALAFERARLRENDLGEAEKARQLASAIGGLTAAATKVAVLAAFIDALPALGAQTGSLALIGEDGTTVDVQGGSEASPYLSDWLTRPIGARTPLITAVRTGDALFIHDRAELASAFDLGALEMFDDTQRSWVAVPLHAGGRPLGALGLSFDALQRFDDTQRVRLASFAALCANALTRAARFELEHSIAITLQSTLLPKRLKPITDVQMSAHYSPGARELSVGGDWYDVIELSEERFLLVVGDVVGHGIESAAAMGKLATATRALAQVEDAPAALLRQLDRVASADASTQFASMAIVLVDRRAGELRYSLAGHPAPLLKLADGSIQSLDAARSIPLGGLAVERPEQALPFRGHVSILLYTDGLTERRAEHIDLRIELLHSAFGQTNVAIHELPRALISEMLNGGDQNDDIAVLCARFEPVMVPFRRLLPVHTSHLAALRSELRAWMANAGPHPGDSDDCLVAVCEAVTNAVEHGNDIEGRPIDMRADYRDNRFSFSVADHGNWRPPVGSDGARGRGLNLIHLLMDDTRVDKTEHGTTITFTKAVMVREGSG